MTDDRTRLLTHSATEPPSSSDPAGEGQTGGPRAARPGACFYRVTFTDERSFRLWTERVVEFTATLRDILPDLHEIRPVIFVPLHPATGAALHAYVSAGARGLAAHMSGGARVDLTPLTLSELPAGLTMLFGEGADADEYENRHA